MKLKALGITTAVAAILLTGSAGFAQNAATTANAANCPAAGFTGGFSRGCPQKQFAEPGDVSAMMAALPDKPYVTPTNLRRVLVLCRAVGWVHTSIPLAAKMVEYLGDKTGAWMTTISYDPATITPENLKQYDAIFLSRYTIDVNKTYGTRAHAPADSTSPYDRLEIEGLHLLKWENGRIVEGRGAIFGDGITNFNQWWSPLGADYSRTEI